MDTQITFVPTIHIETSRSTYDISLKPVVITVTSEPDYDINVKYSRGKHGVLLRCIDIFKILEEYFAGTLGRIIPQFANIKFQDHHMTRFIQFIIVDLKLSKVLSRTIEWMPEEFHEPIKEIQPRLGKWKTRLDNCRNINQLNRIASEDTNKDIMDFAISIYENETTHDKLIDIIQQCKIYDEQCNNISVIKGILSIVGHTEIVKLIDMIEQSKLSCKYDLAIEIKGLDSGHGKCNILRIVNKYLKY